MTKEELEKEAEDIVYGMGYDTCEYEGHSDFAVQDILVKFVESREKHIAELEEQIEKMKLCQNCKFEDNDFIEEPCRNCSRCLGDIKRKGNVDKWELANE